MQTKHDVINWLEANRERFTNLSDDIWANLENSFHEFYASRLQADFLEAEGFVISRDEHRFSGGVKKCSKRWKKIRV